MRDRSHACFGKKRLEKIKFRTFTKRVGPRILSLESVEQTCGKPYLQKLETEDRSDKRGGAGGGGVRLFCCWVQGPMLGAATNAGKCLDGDLLLITVHSIYVL